MPKLNSQSTTFLLQQQQQQQKNEYEKNTKVVFTPVEATVCWHKVQCDCRKTLFMSSQVPEGQPACTGIKKHYSPPAVCVCVCVCIRLCSSSCSSSGTPVCGAGTSPCTGGTLPVRRKTCTHVTVLH